MQDLCFKNKPMLYGILGKKEQPLPCHHIWCAFCSWFLELVFRQSVITVDCYEWVKMEGFRLLPLPCQRWKSVCQKYRTDWHNSGLSLSLQTEVPSFLISHKTGVSVWSCHVRRPTSGSDEELMLNAQL